MGVPTEKAITKRVRDYLKAQGVVFYKQHGSAFSQAGTPDFLCLYKGVFLGIEVKRPHPASRLRPEQDRELSRITAQGGVAIVARGHRVVAPVLNRIDSLEGFESDGEGDTVWQALGEITSKRHEGV